MNCILHVPFKVRTSDKDVPIDQEELMLAVSIEDNLSNTTSKQTFVATSSSLSVSTGG